MKLRFAATTVIAATAGVLFAASAASAAVTFDAGTGQGFVGKGDVQTALGWNNSKLQANAAAVSFTYDATDTYAAVCTWTTGAGTRGEKTHNVSIPRHSRVESAVAYDARTHKQIDGFILTGFGATTVEGTVPVVGGACVSEEGNGNDGTWTAVTLQDSTGALYVNYGGASVALQ